MNQTDFSTLMLDDAMLRNLSDLGYEAMTPVQAQALPVILQGGDVVVRAKTGSGKTAAFGIGMLTKLDVARYTIQEVVLCPTRELAEQVAGELRRIARYTHNVKVLTLCGGMPFAPQRASLEHGAHIIVGTPGRIQDHLGKGTLRLDAVHTLVLDEADRMLDMGFYDAIMKIVSNLPHSRQTLLFSATYPETIAELSQALQQESVEITVEERHDERTITQRFFESGDEKDATLVHLLRSFAPESAVVFCNRKTTCDVVAGMLWDAGFHAHALHGDMEQFDRTEVLTLFANGSCNVLVATDVAARGLDIKGLDAVINYDIPHDPEVYVHRIGRTGRAGESGMALSICTPDDEARVGAIEAYTGTLANFESADALEEADAEALQPRFATLCIDAGKKQKIRPGDILGALTGEAGIPGSDVGKIDVQTFNAYVAIARASAPKALDALKRGKIKGRNFRVWSVE